MIGGGLWYGELSEPDARTVRRTVPTWKQPSRYAVPTLPQDSGLDSDYASTKKIYFATRFRPTSAVAGTNEDSTWSYPYPTKLQSYLRFNHLSSPRVAGDDCRVRGEKLLAVGGPGKGFGFAAGGLTHLE